MSVEAGAAGFIVLRPAPGLPADFLPRGMDGRWDVRPDLDSSLSRWPLPGVTYHAQAIPAGRYETRDDGALAEVWEVRPI